MAIDAVSAIPLLVDTCTGAAHNMFYLTNLMSIYCVQDIRNIAIEETRQSPYPSNPKEKRQVNSCDWRGQNGTQKKIKPGRSEEG